MPARKGPVSGLDVTDFNNLRRQYTESNPNLHSKPDTATVHGMEYDVRGPEGGDIVEDMFVLGKAEFREKWKAMCLGPAREGDGGTITV